MNTLEKVARKISREITDEYKRPLDAVRALTQWIYTSYGLSAAQVEALSGAEAAAKELYGACGIRDRLFGMVCQHWELEHRRAALFNVPYHHGHVGSEVKIGDRWAFFDATFGVYFADRQSGAAMSAEQARAGPENVDILQSTLAPHTGIPAPVQQLSYEVVRTSTLTQSGTVAGRIDIASLYWNSELNYEWGDSEFRTQLFVDCDQDGDLIHADASDLSNNSVMANGVDTYMPYASHLRRTELGGGCEHEYIFKSKSPICVRLTLLLGGNASPQRALGLLRVGMRHFDRVYTPASLTPSVQIRDGNLVVTALVFPPVSNLRLCIRQPGVIYFGGLQAIKCNYAEDALAKAMLDWHRADLGDASCMTAVASQFFRGDILEKNHEQSFRYYDRAAQLGVSSSRYMKGFMLRHGYGVEKDEAKAASWLRMAAKEGIEMAAIELAKLYFDTGGSHSTQAEVNDLLAPIASTGNPVAESLISRLQTSAA